MCWIDIKLTGQEGSPSIHINSCRHILPIEIAFCGNEERAFGMPSDYSGRICFLWEGRLNSPFIRASTKPLCQWPPFANSTCLGKHKQNSPPYTNDSSVVKSTFFLLFVSYIAGEFSIEKTVSPICDMMRKTTYVLVCCVLIMSDSDLYTTWVVTGKKEYSP